MFRENDSCSFVILAYALADGRELWRTTLPATFNMIFEAFLAHQAAALTVLIRDQAFRLDPTTGQCLAQATLPGQVLQVAHPTATERLYLIYRDAFGYLTPGLEAVRLLEASPLEISTEASAHADQLYLLPRRENYIAVWDAAQAVERHRIDTARLKINVRAITPLPANPNRLALRLKDANVAAVLDLPTGELAWKSRLKAQYLQEEDGFGSYLLTPVENGLVVTLWSVGSDEEMSVLCDPETGEELYAFGRKKIRHAAIPGGHLTYDKTGLQIYARAEAPATRTGYLTLKSE